MPRLIQHAALLCALTAATSATTLPQRSTRELVTRAERVCCARCEIVEPRVDVASGLVFTHVRLRRLEDYKGSGDTSTFWLRLIGGRVGDRETRVAGMPRFRKGGECVLFLGKQNRAGFHVVLQAALGTIDVRTDRKTGEQFLARGTSGMPGLADADRGGRVTLARFGNAVRRAVRDDKKARR